MTWGFAVLMLAGAGAPVPPPTVTTKFRIESKNHTSVDLSMFGQPNQEGDVNITAWIRLTLSDTTGGRIVHIVVDSAKLDGVSPLTQASADSAKGGTIHGVLEGGARPKSLASVPASNPVLAEIQGIVNGMFPKIKPGAGPGDTWSDSSDVTNSGGGQQTKTVFAMQYTAGEKETVAGMPAMKITATTNSKISGTLDNPQMGTMEMEGQGTGTASFSTGADGRFLGGTLASTINTQVKAAMAPAPIPVKSVRSVTVTLLP